MVSSDVSLRASVLIAVIVLLVLLPTPAAAFGAGNIPSIAQVEGQNFRHGGEIEQLIFICHGSG